MDNILRGNIPDLCSRDYASLLEDSLDIDAQLIAIRHLLSRHRKADKSLDDEIKKIGKHAENLKGIANEFAVHHWVDLVHSSVYQDAAHSMAAVGMLAPLIETIFHRYFQAMRDQFFQTIGPPLNHDRWQALEAKRWDCHYVFTNNRFRKDICRGILQLSNALGLTNKLPDDLEPTLSALFGYRNKMFHFGFEWPVKERTKFKQRIADERWPSDWFSEATTGSKPWISYLTESFIKHCFTTIDKVRSGFGEFVRDELLQ